MGFQRRPGAYVDFRAHCLTEPGNARPAVEGVMDASFPVFLRTLGLEHLSMYLERSGGAVLVKAESGETYRIITENDLISALAPSSQTI